MSRHNALTALSGQLAQLPFLLRRRPFRQPHKVLIIQTGSMSEVMQATPLLAALRSAFPQARFDWLVSEWSRPAIAGNPHLTELVTKASADVAGMGRRQLGQLVHQLRTAHYDTAFIVSPAAVWSYVGWRAGISQRIGLNIDGRGFAHTTAVKPPAAIQNRAEQGLLLAQAVGVETDGVGEEFRPSDSARRRVTQLLVEEVDWLGDVPLVILHPGGGNNPLHAQPLLRWPRERFAILGNHLGQAHNARVIILGLAEERERAEAIRGMMATRAINYCGRLSLAELGALCEVADLYVGNDTGTSHVAAACGCQTVVIYGPTDAAISKPYSKANNVHALGYDPAQQSSQRPFTWEDGLTAGEALAAVDGILERPSDRPNAMTILSGRMR